MVFDRIDRQLNGWQVLGAAIVAVAALAFLAFIAWPHLHDLTGGSDVFQLWFGGYDDTDAVQLVGALRSAGAIHYYGATEIVAEIVLAVFGFVALTTLFLWLSRPDRRFAAPLDEPIRLLIVGFLGAAFITHVVESFAIWGILASATPTDGVVHFASTMTAVKSVAYVGGLAAILATAIVAIARGIAAPPPIRG